MYFKTLKSVVYKKKKRGGTKSKILFALSLNVFLYFFISMMELQNVGADEYIWKLKAVVYITLKCDIKSVRYIFVFLDCK